MKKTDPILRQMTAMPALQQSRRTEKEKEEGD